MATHNKQKRKTQQSHHKRSGKRLYKRNEQEPTNPNQPEQSGAADQGVKPTQPPEQGATGSANPKFDQSKPLVDDWGKSDKH